MQNFKIFWPWHLTEENRKKLNFILIKLILQLAVAISKIHYHVKRYKQPASMMLLTENEQFIYICVLFMIAFLFMILLLKLLNRL